MRAASLELTSGCPKKTDRQIRRLTHQIRAAGQKYRAPMVHIRFPDMGRSVENWRVTAIAS